MKYKFKIEVDKYFNLERTFNCGQCFRFDEQTDGSFIGIANDKIIKLYQENNNIYMSCDKSEYNNIWYKYFDLDRDYESIAKELSKIDTILKKAVEFSPGIHILRQNSFEALISFIISQNNNIPRIKGIVARLCNLYGKEIEENIFSFPNVDDLDGLDLKDLAPIRCGFRDKYIMDAVSKVKSGEINFDEIRELPLNEAREKLMRIKGVGPKVADCVLIYGLHRLDAFPMDVWMKRTMKTFFPDKSPDYFGDYAGIAGQYLFHYSRVGKAIEKCAE